MYLEEIQEVLADNDLSSYQARAFVALLKLGDASVSEIVENCTVPQPRIYDVLRSLSEKELVETYEDDSLRARIVDPAELISELEAKSNQYAEAADKIDEVWEQPPIGESDVVIFNDFKQVVTHAVEAIERANDCINVAATGSEFLELKTALCDAKDDGVIVNISIHLEDSSRTDVSDLEGYFESTVSEVRHRRSSSPFLTLVDANESYFGVPRRGRGYGIFIQDQALSSMLYGHFQHSLWGRWETIYSDRTSTFPKKYTSIRKCITEIAPRLADGQTLSAAVSGYETETGRETRVEGRVIDVQPRPDSDVRTRDSDVATIVVENESGTHSVGGFGAIVEDVRATTIRIESDA